MVKLSEDDVELVCPISQFIFYDPVIINECGHSFEQSALATHREKSIAAIKKKEADADQPLTEKEKLHKCPSCRTLFKSFERNEGMAERVKTRLEEQPELIYEQFVPIDRRDQLNQLKGLILAGKSKAAIQFIRTHQDKPYLRYANIDEDTGQTALHLFAAGGDLDGIKVLIELGTSTEQTDSDGKTALDIAKANNDACYKYLSAEVEPKKEEDHPLDLARIKPGIEAYLKWRKDNAPGARYERLFNPGGVHWYHGPSGVIRAERLLQLANRLEGGWNEVRYKAFEREFDRSMAVSSHTEHSLKSFIERALEPSVDEMTQLDEIEQGINQYLAWSRLNTQGIRGITRFSHMYHGQSGVARADDLLARIQLVKNEKNMYRYNQFEKAYQRARTQSSGTEHSLVRFIDGALHDDEYDNKYVL